jgi:hypothetical protein
MANSPEVEMPRPIIPHNHRSMRGYVINCCITNIAVLIAPAFHRPDLHSLPNSWAD